ncbi:MFS transporter [Agathobaculum sp. Marseille-P7918]|uniref:MFS transporter n=1 Tax=Agathobaculum sp. Marseille-P7918 TaxID=2479843 RepID=UPI0035699820
MSEKTKARPFGIRDKVGYMFGDFGNDFTFLLSSVYLMKFYTDVMGIAPYIVGILMTVARFIDAITDVTMGQICDRSRPTAKGKFVPWLRRMCGPVAVASFLMYAFWLENMSMTFKVVWMFATYILWGSVFYTSINIPYGSMASAISAEAKDRQELSSWRTIGATLASTVIGVVLPLIVYYTDAAGNSVLSGSRMGFAALGCSIGAVICYLICYKMTTERVKIEQETEKFNLLALLKYLLTNRALIGIIVAAIMLLLAQLSLSSMAQYIYPNYFRSSAAISASNLGTSVLTIALAAVMPPLVQKFGKKELSIFGALLGAAALIVGYILHTDNVVLFVVINLIAFLGIAFFNVSCWAMITDVIDDAEVRTGKRADGTIYATYSFARKLGQAASSGLTGGLLSLIGYSAATQFDQNVVDGIYNITCIVPAGGFILLALALIFIYPLSKKRVDANIAALKAKREQ